MSQRENLPKSDQGLQPGDPETKSTSLRKGTLGLIGIVFFVVAAAAPLAGMTGAFPVAMGIGVGAGAAGMYVAVGIILLLFSVGYATMSHYVTNTGAFFAYVGRGLGIKWGVASAFASVAAYIAVMWAVLGFISGQMTFQMEAKLGLTLPWWVYAFIMLAIVFALSAASVDIGAKVLGVLLTVELLGLVFVALAIIFQGGGPDGLDFGASFSPASVLGEVVPGGVGIAFAFALASFIGFEATAIYGEESKDPKKTVPRATYTSVLLITVLFGVIGFGLVSGLGATDIQNKVFEVTAIDGVPLSDPSAILFGLSTEFVGSWLTEAFSWLILTSLFAALLAFQNSAARYFFAMGRAGVLPKKLDHTNGAQAPLTATALVTVLGVIITVLGIIFTWDPILNIFYWFGGVAVIAIVLTEIMVSIAVIVYFARTKEDTRLWHTKIAPVLAIIGLTVGEYLLMAHFNLFSGTSSTEEANAWELNTLGWILVLLPFAMFIIGLVVGVARKGKENYDAVHNFAS
jgi:amino acid transporter